MLQEFDEVSCSGGYRDLQKLTMGTTRVFDGLYSSVGAQVDDVNDRTMLYLSMRFNRRIIQNALACQEDILSRRRLGTTQQANYRWMLIQPFMAIDDYSAAVLTEEQRELLLALSDDLPVLLERLDARKHVRDKENNLTEVLSEYLVEVMKPCFWASSMCSGMLPGCRQKFWSIKRWMRFSRSFSNLAYL